MKARKSKKSKTSLDSLTHDRNGKIIPDAESKSWALREHAGKTDHEKYLLACAHTLVQAFYAGHKKEKRS